MSGMQSKITRHAKTQENTIAFKIIIKVFLLVKVIIANLFIEKTWFPF